MLEEAVVTYREALKEGTRERDALAWAMIQNNLGNVLSRVGQRKGISATQQEAILAYSVFITISSNECTYL